MRSTRALVGVAVSLVIVSRYRYIYLLGFPHVALLASFLWMQQKTMRTTSQSDVDYRHRCFFFGIFWTCFFLTKIGGKGSCHIDQYFCSIGLQTTPVPIAQPTLTFPQTNIAPKLPPGPKKGSRIVYQSYQFSGVYFGWDYKVFSLLAVCTRVPLSKMEHFFWIKVKALLKQHCWFVSLYCWWTKIRRSPVERIPSRELTYPPKMAFWRWFSFSPGGIC